MTPEIALQKRNQLITDGYCVIDNILTRDFLEELRRDICHRDTEAQRKNRGMELRLETRRESVWFSVLCGLTVWGTTIWS
jgi:hypothetical protein